MPLSALYTGPLGARSLALPPSTLRGTSGGATMTASAHRAHYGQDSLQLPPRARRTDFSHRVGASMANGLRPLYCPWPRCFVYHTIPFGAALALPCCALRGISGGATMTYRSPGRFLVSPSSPGQGSFLCTLGPRACQFCT